WPRSLEYRDDPSRAYSSIDVVINSSDERSDIGETFVVTWEGSGHIEVGNGADVERDDERRRLTFTLQNDVTVLRFTEIDPEGTGDHLRDVRVFRADFEPLLEA